MRFLLLLALVLPAASAARPPSTPVRAAAAPAAECLPAPRVRTAGRPVATRGVARLGDEPSADLAFAVWSHVGGCYRPILIREGIGFGPGQPPSRP